LANFDQPALPNGASVHKAHAGIATICASSQVRRWH